MMYQKEILRGLGHFSIIVGVTSVFFYSGVLQ